MFEILFPILVFLLLLILLVMQLRQPARSAHLLEQQHRAMLADLNDGLNKQGDRLIASQAVESERLRAAVSEELRATRDAVNALQAKQDLLRTEMLAQTLAKLAEQGRADQELIQNSFRNATQHLATSIEALSKTVDGRLEQIGGKVNERLDEGFKKTNETFVSVMTRLATIDEAQKKIDGLTTNMVSLQELLGDKRSRGAFGEVQLEALVRNIMPPQSYEMQFSLPNGTRADCVLKLPEPTGMV
ncbi:MAG: DNA recombination protein RmuC, partial [Sideroxydans sp.]